MSYDNYCVGKEQNDLKLTYCHVKNKMISVKL